MFKNGVIKNKYDPRDKQYVKLFSASTPFDWSVGYDVEKEISKVIGQPYKTKVKDQNGSGSCGGQTGSYYMGWLEAIQNKTFSNKSAKDIYSQIYYPQGGVAPRDLVAFLTSKGVCREVIIPSYDNGKAPSENFMREKKQTPESKADALNAKALKYATVKLDIDTIAQAIRDNYGCVITLGGQDNGTWLSAFPKPPVKEVWGHYMAFGRAKMINGKKYLGAIQSWGEDVGDKKDIGWQWFGEEWIKHFSNCYTLYNPIDPVVQDKVTLVEKILNLCYDLLSKLGYKTKKKVIS